MGVRVSMGPGTVQTYRKVWTGRECGKSLKKLEEVLHIMVVKSRCDTEQVRKNAAVRSCCPLEMIRTSRHRPQGIKWQRKRDNVLLNYARRVLESCVDRTS